MGPHKLRVYEALPPLEQKQAATTTTPTHRHTPYKKKVGNSSSFSF